MHLTPIMWTNNQQLLFDTEGTQKALLVLCTLAHPLLDFGIKGGLSTPGGVLTNWKEIVGNASTLNTGYVKVVAPSVEMAC